MKRFFALSGVLITLLVALFLKINQQGEKEEENEKEEREEIGRAFDYLDGLRINPFTKQVSLEDKLSSFTEVNRFRNKTDATLLSWNELGPDNVGGRTRAVLVDKTNPSKIFAGSVSGGIWVSTTGGSSWSKISDTLQNICVVSIAQATNGDIYFGTGEYIPTITSVSTGDASSSFSGQGVFKSSDGGKSFKRLTSTWDALSSFEKTGWQYVSGVACDPQKAGRIYAATYKGLKISDDGGTTWRSAKLATGVQIPSSYCSDVKVGSDGTVIVAVADQVYISPDGEDKSFIKLTSNQIPVNGIFKKFAFAPGNPRFIYCSSAASDGSLFNIYQSTDKGVTWKVIGPGGGKSFQPFGNQGFYDNAIAVSPSDPQTVFVGGLNLFSWTPSQGWKQLTAWNYVTWNEAYLHADIHCIAFQPNNGSVIYIGSDGGVAKSIDGGKSYHTINKRYNVTQFYSVAYTTSGEVFGGTQDNGTQFIDYMGSTSQQSDRIYGGDGGYSQASRINPNVFFTEYVHGEILRSAEKGKGFAGFYDRNIKPESVGFDPDFSLFITPFELWEKSGLNADTSFFVGLKNSVWVTKKALDFTITPKWYKIASGTGPVQCLAPSKDGKQLFAGTRTGELVRIDNIDHVNNSLDTNTYYRSGIRLSRSDLTQPEQNGIGISSSVIATFGITGAERVVTSISVDQSDANHVIVTLGNYGVPDHVYESTNALSANPVFTSIQANLPAVPVYSSLIDVNDPLRIILGTETGTFASFNGGKTWSEANKGMARVPVFMIRQNPSNGSIYLATHGRGLFYSDSFVTGIKEKKSDNLSTVTVFPNPAADFIKLSLEDIYERSGLVIYNLNGQKVYENRSLTSDKEMIVSVKDFLPGAYILSLSKDGRVYHTSRFIVAR